MKLLIINKEGLVKHKCILVLKVDIKSLFMVYVYETKICTYGELSTLYVYNPKDLEWYIEEGYEIIYIK